MPCNCGKKKTTKWVYISPDGKKVVYPTEVQAKAAALRNGGGTVAAA